MSQIKIANMCPKHQSLLIHQAKYKESDPWQALIIASQIVLFQAATCDERTYPKLDKDISRIEELGCLACYKPDVFGEIVEAANTHDLKKVKEIGDKYIAKYQKKENNSEHE